MSESGGLSPGKRWYTQVGNYLSVLFVLMFAVLTPSASQAPIAVAADTLIPPDRSLFLGRGVRPVSQRAPAGCPDSDDHSGHPG
ncbi:MAG: hypothetical protein ACM3VX_01180 [Bacteroidota bacterium]